MVGQERESGCSRRRFLGGVVGGSTAAVGGCLGGSAEPSAVLAESFTIEHRDWASLEFSRNRHGRIEYEATVTDGPAVDLLLMHSVEFANYADGDGFDFLGYVSRLDTEEASVADQVSAGEFVFVVDNTNRVGAKVLRHETETVATVDVTLKVYGK